MNETLAHTLDRTVDAYVGAAPGHWIRVVLWALRLDDDETSAAFACPCVAVTWDGQQLEQRAVAPDAADTIDGVAIDRAAAGGPEAGWTMLRIEVDRDGERRYDFAHDGAVPADDAATDEFWDQAHEYLDRNRPALEDLARRLGASGDLPGPEDVTAVDPRTLPPHLRPGSSAADQKESGLLGRLFGRG